jgi:hypothetical protein
MTGGQVELVSLTKRFAEVAVDSIDLAIPSGEFFTLLGPSSCSMIIPAIRPGFSSSSRATPSRSLNPTTRVRFTIACGIPVLERTWAGLCGGPTSSGSGQTDTWTESGWP